MTVREQRLPTDSVLAISIDGLNPNALRVLGRQGTPNLHAFMNSGASTLNARTSYEMTVTLPNHTGMVTGRRIAAAKGGHGVTWNDDRKTPATVQQAAKHDVASVFTQVAGSGGSTALFASKTKFTLWQRSWPDAISHASVVEDNAVLVNQVVADLATTQRAFRFVHLSLPDVAGHASGFMSNPYLKAVRRVDTLVGSLMNAVDSDPDLAATTTTILTSDHGGIGGNHVAHRRLGNYRIAFMVRGPEVTRGDLYALNPDYRNPGVGRPSYAAKRQPVRNAALANLALDLLGLPAVEGSEINAAQNLDVTAVSAKPELTNTERPAIRGIPRQGRVLHAFAGRWTPRRDETRFRWLRDGKPIPGARTRHLRLGADDVGARIGLEVRAHSEGHGWGLAKAKNTAPIGYGRPVRRRVTYSIATRGPVRANLGEFARQAQETYADPRGWRAGGIEFRRVRYGGHFTLMLSTAAMVPSFSSVCSSFWSCRVGRYVIINQDRWLGASPAWNHAGRSLRDYRHMVINHETGHWLGRGHAHCPGSGPAPVMMQQSKGTGGCSFNPWPLPWELPR